MAKRIKNNPQGFTLIELMIVVTILGILTAIAIPNFLNYQLKSKTSEARTNIGSIRTLQATYKAENDIYLNCIANIGIFNTGQKQPWTLAANSGFDSIGFAPIGSVYYQYDANAGGLNDTEVCISAEADLDGDGNYGQFGFTSDLTAVNTTTTMTTACTASNQVLDLSHGDYQYCESGDQG